MQVFVTSAGAPVYSGRGHGENSVENTAAVAEAGSGRAGAGVSDQHLVGLVASGDLDALVELYDRFATVAYGLALAVLQSRSFAEDAVEAGFLDVWQSAGGYAPRDSSVRAWVLARILRHAIARKRDVSHSGNGDRLEPTSSGVFDLLAPLPSEEREAIALAVVGGLNRSEVAAVAGVTADEIGRNALGAQASERACFSASNSGATSGARTFRVKKTDLKSIRLGLSAAGWPRRALPAQRAPPA